ncbi:hypothetical protein QZH41_007397 [Actinostola sp. cb2023]|nr:hypothetical protein QZH41_007397 [Actinostola sp. cb2023]
MVPGTSFLRIGWKKGERVAIQAPSGIGFLLSYMALNRIGALSILLPEAIPIEETIGLLNHYKCQGVILFVSKDVQLTGEHVADLKKTIEESKVVMIDTEHSQVLDNGCSRFSNLLMTGETDFSKVLERQSQVQFDDLAHVILTSGSTGEPKAVVRTHHCIVNSALMASKFGFDIDYDAYRKHSVDRLFNDRPFYWGGGLLAISIALSTGCTLLTAPPIKTVKECDIEFLLKLLQNERCTSAFLMPYLVVDIANCSRLLNYDLSFLKAALTAGQPIPNHIFEKVRLVAPNCKLIKAYGMAECSAIARQVLGQQEGEEGLELICLNELKIVDENIQVLPVGQVGEICLRSPKAFLKYLFSPDATSKTVSRTGWVHTGDLGKINSKGRLTITGRKDDMIKRATVKIFPAEVEKVLTKYDDVKDASVVGVPDVRLYEELCACIIPKKGSALESDMADFEKWMSQTFTPDEQGLTLKPKGRTAPQAPGLYPYPDVRNTFSEDGLPVVAIQTLGGVWVLVESREYQVESREYQVESREYQKGQAVEAAFESAASEAKRLEEAALILRREIQSCYNVAGEMPSPPSTSFLVDGPIKPPSSLTDFIGVVISSKKDSEKKQRIASSIAQDICKAATNGQWMMPKHLLLGMSLRHLTGSAEVVSILNRLGHCTSYSGLLELETAICKSIDDKESTIPSTIDPSKNVVTHLCWDNFDLREETPSGAGTTHTAHGIIIQEVSDVNDGTTNVSNAHHDVPKTKRRSIQCILEDYEPCFAKEKVEPNITITKTTVEKTQAESKARSSDVLWFICRAIMPGPDSQIVPPWAGWVSKTGTSEKSSQQSTVDYMAPIFAPVTENSTVQHILKVSQQASREVHQQYTVVTFDLAVAKKAYALVWQNPEIFSDVIVQMGSFHLLCSYMSALGKLMRCSGLEEVLVESGVCASGSIQQVMAGKHYNRAIRVHKIVLEALERLLLDVFENQHEEELTEETKELLCRLADDPCEENLSNALSSESCAELLLHYSEFKAKVCDGQLGKTAQFWLKYMEKVWLILRFLRATKENNFELHIASLEQMASLFFALDHPNYARYTTVYLMILLNLEETHPGAKELLSKQTINRHAKSHGGIIGFSRNHSAYYRWCKTRHVRASYLQATREMVDMDNSECTTHKELRSSQIMKSEEDVYEVGMKAHTAFVNDRLVEQEISFHSSIKRQNLKTFASLLVMLALDYDLDMKRVLSYPLGPVPWALATSDGMPVKTEKAKLLHFLDGKNQVQRPTTGEIFYVIDGNALLHAMVAIPSTFGDLADSVFEQLPKEVERSRRGTSAPHLVRGPLTKVPRDWKKFLSNGENKRRLSNFLLEEWKNDRFAEKLQGREVVVVCEEKAVCLTSVNDQQTVSEEMLELCSTQEEGDTKMILH